VKSPDRAEVGQVWKDIYTGRMVQLTAVNHHGAMAEGIPIPRDRVVRFSLVKGMVRGHRLVESK
jgi:hypothetical protein